MEALVTGVGVHDDELSLELRAEEKELLAIRTGEKLSFIVSGERRCVGHRPPGAESLLACPKNEIGIGSSQCPDCLQAALILPCLRCDGERCRNPARRGECVQPLNHAVYLASFGPGRPKVGVARWNRRRERLLEQGARAALIVARDDGQLVRRTEQQISRTGIPDRLSAQEKLLQLTQAGRPDELEVELRELYQSLKRRIRAEWLPEPEPVELDEQPLLEIAPRLISPEAGLRISGLVSAVVGQLVIVEADTGEQIAIEASSLAGFPLAEIGAEAISTGQMAIAF